MEFPHSAPVRGMEALENPSYSDSEAVHAVIIQFYYGIEGDEPFYELADKLMQLLANSEAGWYDGHEIAMDNSDGSFYMYGPNAERLFKAILPTLQETGFMKGAVTTLRFGPPKEGVPEIDVEI